MSVHPLEHSEPERIPTVAVFKRVTLVMAKHVYGVAVASDFNHAEFGDLASRPTVALRAGVILLAASGS